MNYLYVDNFRGFNDQLMSFSDINFFVGENSTGKTSILSIIHILTSTDFWSSGSFPSSGMGLESFDDIVSANAKNKDYFVAGIGRKVEGKIIFLLCKFQSEDGLPKVSVIAATNGNEMFSIKFEKTVNGSNYTELQNKADINHIVNALKKRIHSNKIKTIPLEIPARFINLLIDFYPFILENSKANSASKAKKATPTFKNDIKEEKIIEPIIQNLYWIAPIRSDPQQIYSGNMTQSSPEGNHIPFLLRKIFTSQDKKSKEASEKLKSYGKKSGLFDDIKVKAYGGDSMSNPFSIDVVLSGSELNLKHVGYGVSQILPVIYEIISRPRGGILIQQPEVHLHPKAQAVFGEALYNLSQKFSKPLFIETHSDFMIDRFRHSISKSKNYTKNARVLFFMRTKSGNKVLEITIDNEGRYPDDQPNEFREFFLNESISLLGI